MHGQHSTRQSLSNWFCVKFLSVRIHRACNWIPAMTDAECLWKDVWSGLGGPGDGSSVFADLTARYAEPHRAYHTLRHILDCLDEFGSVRNLANNPVAIETAIWFHDAVYRPLSNSNEEESAELAATVLQNAEVDAEFISAVRNLIVATKHTAPPVHQDEKLLVDVDLAILGQDEAVFDRYELQIRKEYKIVPSPLFKAGRLKVLRGFLSRPTVFETEVFRLRYEEPARRNISRAIDALI